MAKKPSPTDGRPERNGRPRQITAVAARRIASQINRPVGDAVDFVGFASDLNHVIGRFWARIFLEQEATAKGREKETAGIASTCRQLAAYLRGNSRAGTRARSLVDVLSADRSLCLTGADLLSGLPIRYSSEPSNRFIEQLEVLAAVFNVAEKSRSERWRRSRSNSAHGWLIGFALPPVFWKHLRVRRSEGRACRYVTLVVAALTEARIPGPLGGECTPEGIETLIRRLREHRNEATAKTSVNRHLKYPH